MRLGTANYVAAGRAGLAVFLVGSMASTTVAAARRRGLRRTLPVGRGSAVIVRGSAGVERARTDVWGPIGDGLSLMRAVKRQFDPAGILNAGRGPGGTVGSL